MTTQPNMRGIRPAGYVLDEAPLGRAAQAADDLRAVREQWGDLLTVIGRPPRAEWPPRDSRALGAVPDDEPTVGRLPLILREHPAPLNLTALDAALAVEELLFDMCDAVAERVQRPVVPGEYRVDQADRDDPARWRLPTAGSALLPRPARIITGTDPRAEDTEEARTRRAGRLARLAEHIVEQPKAQRHATTASASEVPYASTGSRRHGLHWAAVWLEGRALDEPHGTLFAPTPAPLTDQLAQTARRARLILERALNRDGRPTALDRPCPYCRGPLTAHTRSGDPAAATVVCGTGSSCTAPVLLNGRGRREWAGPELVGLFVALEATAS